MAWIEFHTELRDHWKINRLKDSLGIKYAEALGLMGCLWTWAAIQSPKGNLSGFTDAEIASASRYDGDAKMFKNSLKTAKLLDASGRLHDWHKHGIRLLNNARNRVKKHRDMKHNSNVTKTLEKRSTLPSLLSNRSDLTKALTLKANDASRLPKNGYDKDLVDEVCRVFDDEKSRGFYVQEARRLGDGRFRECFADVKSRIREGKDIKNPSAYLAGLLKNEKGG